MTFHTITELKRLEGTTRDHQVQPPAKASTLQQVTQVGIQIGLEYLQGRRIHNLPRQAVLMLCYPHCEEVPLYIGAELSMLKFMAISPCPIPTDH